MPTRTLRVVFDLENTRVPQSATLVVDESQPDDSEACPPILTERCAVGQVARLERALVSRFRVPVENIVYEYERDGRLEGEKFDRCANCADFAACLEQGACRQS